MKGFYCWFGVLGLSHALQDGEGVAFGVDGLCNPCYAGDLLFGLCYGSSKVSDFPDGLVNVVD
jgi:hypothetical protein